MMIKSRVLTVLLSSLCLLFCSCGTQNRISDGGLSDEAISDTDSMTESDADSLSESEEDDEVVLTDRQIQILEDAGLPTDYSALDSSQKSAISSIETMLTYLEESYDTEFCYIGYVASGGMDTEHLTVYVKDDPDQKVITLYRTYEDGRYCYSDNYKEIMITDSYQAILEQYFDSALNGGEYKLFVRVDSYDEDGEDLFSAVGAENTVFIENAFSSEEEMGVLIDSFGEWVSSHEMEYPMATSFIIQDKADYESTDADNCENRINEGAYVFCQTYAILADGTVKIY